MLARIVDPIMVAAKAVSCRYMVGLTLNQTLSQWHHDITSARNATIDGFALNIGARDYFTVDALRGAYDIAAEVGKFSPFLSFDFAADEGWNVSSVSDPVNSFKNEPTQFRVDGKPLVSTFESVEFADGWNQVREKVDGGIHFVPDWSSLEPEGVGRMVDQIDRHCM